MQVRKLDTRRARDVRAFIRFPFDLYRDCPQWVPPLRPAMRAALDRDRYAFYQTSAADFFVVENKGQVLGRVVDPVTSEVRETCTSPVNGMIISRRVRMPINPGGYIAHIADYDSILRERDND